MMAIQSFPSLNFRHEIPVLTRYNILLASISFLGLAGITWMVC